MPILLRLFPLLHLIFDIPMCRPQSAQWDWEEWEEESVTEPLLTALSLEKVDALQMTPLHAPSPEYYTKAAKPSDMKVSGLPNTFARSSNSVCKSQPQNPGTATDKADFMTLQYISITYPIKLCRIPADTWVYALVT